MREKLIMCKNLGCTTGKYLLWHDIKIYPLFFMRKIQNENMLVGINAFLLEYLFVFDERLLNKRAYHQK